MTRDQGPVTGAKKTDHRSQVTGHALTRPSEVRALLDELDFHPSKVLGQNFLIDANILNIMIDTANVSKRDTVVEIGPGLGVLTGRLAEKAKRLVAIEKDKRLHAFLQRSLASLENLELILADALDVDIPVLGADKVVANLPYSVGSRLLMNLFMAPAGPSKIVVTVQLEVADRLAASPGSDDYGLLSVWAQLRYDAHLRKVISPTCFFPPPQVKSAIVELDRRVPEIELRHPDVFRDLVKRAFSFRRKQMGTILKNPGALEKAGIDPQARPENLSVADWVRLSDHLQ